MGSSWTRYRTCISCIDRWILNHRTTRELPVLPAFINHALFPSALTKHALSAHSGPIYVDTEIAWKSLIECQSCDRLLLLQVVLVKSFDLVDIFCLSSFCFILRVELRVELQASFYKWNVHSVYILNQPVYWNRMKYNKIEIITLTWNLSGSCLGLKTPKGITQVTVVFHSPAFRGGWNTVRCRAHFCWAGVQVCVRIKWLKPIEERQILSSFTCGYEAVFK